MPNYPDRLSAIAAEAFDRGASSTTHNLGGLHADIHHAGVGTAPAKLPDEVWGRLLAKHRTSA